jgi:fatty acid desaturase
MSPPAIPNCSPDGTACSHSRADLATIEAMAEPHGSQSTVKASEFLTKDQLEAVQARSTWKSVALIVHAWAMILAAMALFAWWPNPLTFIAATIVIGGRQLGLSILMHDGAHGLIARDGAANLALSQWLCAWPVLVDTLAYRKYHLKHHARTQQPDDPDLVLSAPFPVTRASLRRKAMRDLVGRTGLQQRSAQFRAALADRSIPWRDRVRRFADKLGGPLAANAILFALLAAAGHWYLYPLLWLVPLLTVYQLFLRIRNIAEHAMVPDDSDPFRNARTTLAGPLARLTVAPYWVNYHVEHHLLMWVPCYNLPLLHRYLMAGPHGARIEIEKNYRDVLKLATSRCGGDDRGKRVHTDRRRITGLVMETD